jgi:hypothetical protein
LHFSKSNLPSDFSSFFSSSSWIYLYIISTSHETRLFNFSSSLVLDKFLHTRPSYSNVPVVLVELASPK